MANIPIENQEEFQYQTLASFIPKFTFFPKWYVLSNRKTDAETGNLKLDKGSAFFCFP